MKGKSFYKSNGLLPREGMMLQILLLPSRRESALRQEPLRRPGLPALPTKAGGLVRAETLPSVAKPLDSRERRLYRPGNR